MMFFGKFKALVVALPNAISVPSLNLKNSEADPHNIPGESTLKISFIFPLTE